MASNSSQFSSTTVPPQDGSGSTGQPQIFLPATDARFHYDGRIDRSLADGVGLIWQATRVAIDIEGDQLALVFARAEGANFFNVRVDDLTAVIEVPPGRDRTVAFPLPIGLGWHRVTLFKRSEAHMGSVVFSGLQLREGAQVRTSALTPAALKFEFFGDSITAGACNEDGAVDQWETVRTHNNELSYAAVTAAAFGADHRNIAVSGMGMVTGYVDVQAPLIWDRLYPVASSPRADLTQWTPDVVFVNYGENDTSFTFNNNQPFPATYADAYVACVRAIRAAWDSCVARLEAGDARITHFVFTHFSILHPRVADHQAMADELVAWLRQQKFVAAVR